MDQSPVKDKTYVPQVIDTRSTPSGKSDIVVDQAGVRSIPSGVIYTSPYVAENAILLTQHRPTSGGDEGYLTALR